MKVKTLGIYGSCKLEETTYGEGYVPDVCLEYTEHSKDHRHHDSETSIDISKEKAVEIIKFLQDSFGL